MGCASEGSALEACGGATGFSPWGLHFWAPLNAALVCAKFESPLLMIGLRLSHTIYRKSSLKILKWANMAMVLTNSWPHLLHPMGVEPYFRLFHSIHIVNLPSQSMWRTSMICSLKSTTSTRFLSVFSHPRRIFITSETCQVAINVGVMHGVPNCFSRPDLGKCPEP